MRGPITYNYPKCSEGKLIQGQITSLEEINVQRPITTQIIKHLGSCFVPVSGLSLYNAPLTCRVRVEIWSGLGPGIRDHENGSYLVYVLIT